MFVRLTSLEPKSRGLGQTSDARLSLAFETSLDGTHDLRSGFALFAPSALISSSTPPPKKKKNRNDQMLLVFSSQSLFKDVVKQFDRPSKQAGPTPHCEGKAILDGFTTVAPNAQGRIKRRRRAIIPGDEGKRRVECAVVDVPLETA